jgi:hypothetical protein
VAALLVKGNDQPDRVTAEAALIELAAQGVAVRQPLGDDALWKPALVREPAGAGTFAATAS